MDGNLLAEGLRFVGGATAGGRGLPPPGTRARWRRLRSVGGATASGRGFSLSTSRPQWHLRSVGVALSVGGAYLPVGPCSMERLLSVGGAYLRVDLNSMEATQLRGRGSLGGRGFSVWGLTSMDAAPPVGVACPAGGTAARGRTPDPLPPSGTSWPAACGRRPREPERRPRVRGSGEGYVRTSSGGPECSARGGADGLVPGPGARVAPAAARAGRPEPSPCRASDPRRVRGRSVVSESPLPLLGPAPRAFRSVPAVRCPSRRRHVRLAPARFTGVRIRAAPQLVHRG